MGIKPVREAFKPDAVLQNWVELLKALPEMRESECKAALEKEAEGQRRKDFILRLHRRFNRLRGEREFRSLTRPVRKQP